MMRGLNIVKYISGSATLVLAEYMTSSEKSASTSFSAINCQKLERTEIICKAEKLLTKPKSINEYSDNGEIPDLLIFLEKILQEIEGCNWHSNGVIGANLYEHPKLMQLAKDDEHLNYLINADAKYRELCRLTYLGERIGRFINSIKSSDSKKGEGEVIYDVEAQAQHAGIVREIAEIIKNKLEADSSFVKAAFPLLESIPRDHFSDAEIKQVEVLLNKLNSEIHSSTFDFTVMETINGMLEQRFGKDLYKGAGRILFGFPCHPILLALLTEEHRLQSEAVYLLKSSEDEGNPCYDFDLEDARKRAINARQIFKMVDAMLPQVKALEIPKDACISASYYNGKVTFGFEKAPPGLMSQLYSSIGIFVTKTLSKAAKAAQEPYR